MPEWPDLHVARGRLQRALPGRRITGVKVGDPIVIRATRPLEDMLLGRTFDGVRHRGKFILLELDNVTIVVNPMLSGLFLLKRSEAPASKDRRTRKGDDETDYCPTCQPPPPGQLF